MFSPSEINVTIKKNNNNGCYKAVNFISIGSSVVLAVLKLSGLIDISWGFVTSPIWGFYFFVATVIVTLVLKKVYK